MQFWFVHSGEVSLREQIVRQVSLGVLSGELRPDERLPSTRELARRFGIHPNTVSSAYRQLREDGWITARKGAGVFVRSSGVERVPDLAMDARAMAGVFERIVRLSRQNRTTDNELRQMLEDALARENRYVLVEWDVELAAIVRHEVREAGGGELERCTLRPEEFAARLRADLHGGRALVLPSKFEAACAALPKETPPLLLHINPIAGWIGEHLPKGREHLVAVASGWSRFLEDARPAFIATGFDGDCILVRDARQAGWTAGLSTADGVVCDSLTASRLPTSCRPLVYRLLSEACLREVVRMVPGVVANG